MPFARGPVSALPVRFGAMSSAQCVAFLLLLRPAVCCGAVRAVGCVGGLLGAVRVLFRAVAFALLLSTCRGLLSTSRRLIVRRVLRTILTIILRLVESLK